MKRKMYLLCTLGLLVVLTVFLPVPALAAGVTYDGNARDFIFTPGSPNAPTDLFEDFKGVVPGDKITQQIEIVNDASRNVKIKVYLCSTGAQPQSEAFLSQMNLTVSQVGGNLLFDAPADQSAELSDWVCLGTVYSGGKITLDVTLEVPVTMDNEFQDQIGYLDWHIRVEELPVSPDDPEPPKTGDKNPIILWGCLLLVSGVSLALLFAWEKKLHRQ